MFSGERNKSVSRTVSVVANTESSEERIVDAIGGSKPGGNLERVFYSVTTRDRPTPLPPWLLSIASLAIGFITGVVKLVA